MKELSARGRVAGVVLWSSFLAACVAALFCFALIDPEALRAGDVPVWWTGRLKVYSLGFFFFWFVALLGSVLSVRIVRTDRST